MFDNKGEVTAGTLVALFVATMALITAAAFYIGKKVYQWTAQRFAKK